MKHTQLEKLLMKIILMNNKSALKSAIAIQKEVMKANERIKQLKKEYDK
jgi:hypothetical protein